jgi:hypothetical protein
MRLHVGHWRPSHARPESGQNGGAIVARRLANRLGDAMGSDDPAATDGLQGQQQASALAGSPAVPQPQPGAALTCTA